MEPHRMSYRCRRAFLALMLALVPLLPAAAEIAPAPGLAVNAANAVLPDAQANLGIGPRDNFINDGGAFFDHEKEGGATAGLCNDVLAVLPHVTDGYMVQCGSAVAAVSCQRVADAPSGSGLAYSVKCTVATPAAASLGATDLLAIVTSIAGDDMIATGFGTPGALPACLSFWVKASVAGTYAMAFNSDSARQSYVRMFAIPAGQWQKESFCFPGDATTDDWSADGIVNVTFAAGSVFASGVEGWNANPSAAA